MVAVVYRTEVLFHIRYDALRQFAGKGVVHLTGLHGVRTGCTAVHITIRHYHNHRLSLSASNEVVQNRVGASRLVP